MSALFLSQVENHIAVLSRRLQGSNQAAITAEIEAIRSDLKHLKSETVRRMMAKQITTLEAQRKKKVVANAAELQTIKAMLEQVAERMARLPTYAQKRRRTRKEKE